MTKRSITLLDATYGSVSLSMVADHLQDGLGPHMSRRLVAAGHGNPRLLRNLTRGHRDIRVVPYLTTFLGYATYQFPQLHRDAIRVLMVGWELKQLPTTMKAELSGADVILAMSSFNAEVFKRTFPSTPVALAPLRPPAVPEVSRQRERFGLPNDAIVILSTFDPVSGFDRKNPEAVLDAFQLAFPGREDVRLIFKTHGLDQVISHLAESADGRRARQFVERCSRDPRVNLYDRSLPYPEVQTLVASCDIYISLARAEGFGLPVLEAMSLGIPTICTAYSGHLDFATPDSALLVGGEEARISSDASGHYEARFFDEPPMWINADIPRAASWLRELAGSSQMRSLFGARARARAHDYTTASKQARWPEDLLEVCASDHVARLHSTRHRAFENFTRADERAWVTQGEQLRRARLYLEARRKLGRLKPRRWLAH